MLSHCSTLSQDVTQSQHLLEGERKQHGRLGRLSLKLPKLLITEILIDKTSEATEFNEARKQLFTRKTRAVENMPPTKAALEQHMKRAAFQAHVWCKSLETDPQLPSPADWGWVKEESGWQSLWTTLAEASQGCYELIHCGCKKACTNRCKCKKSALKCTALCSLCCTVRPH